MASIGAVGGTMQNLKLYLALDRGLAQARVAEVLSLILVSSLAGRLLMGWLADRWAKKHVMLLVYLIVAGAIPILTQAPSDTMLQARRRRVRAWARGRLHDHPADGGGAASGWRAWGA